jgi:hypothetical protein
MRRPVLSFYIHAVTISLKEKFIIVKVGKSSTDHIMAPISIISHYNIADLLWLLRKDRRRVLVCYVLICMTLKTRMVVL